MIDWQQVCLNLRQHHGNLHRVAKLTQLDERHLQRLARGEVKEPRFNSGVRLLDLHYDVMGERHREIRRIA
jgi:hypothetical protein